MIEKYYIHGQIRDRGCCVYCGRDLIADIYLFWGFLVNDHLVPRAKGGSDTVENHATSCRTCNAVKGDYMPDGYESMNREEIINACRAFIAQKLEGYRHIHDERRRTIEDYPRGVILK